jgi:hypothetical protein
MTEWAEAAARGMAPILWTALATNGVGQVRTVAISAPASIAGAAQH